MSDRNWINRTVLGIVLATFFSDFGHEMMTAVMPQYLLAIGLGAASLGLIEGVADLMVSLSKLGGGVMGHRLQNKRGWAALGYLITAVCTGMIGLFQSLPALVTLRTAAWIGRGYRGPLRDYLLTDAVEKTHYGRAFGLERAGDMLGAVAGPLTAALLVYAGVPFKWIILGTMIPGTAAAAAMFFLTREKPAAKSVTQPTTAANAQAVSATEAPSKPSLPRRYWQFLPSVLMFGLGDFSRTFLIFLAARALGEDKHEASATSALSLAVLLYAAHNLISAAAAYAIGHLADRRAKLPLLTAGYVLGVATNVLLAFQSTSIGWLAVAFVMSGIYLAAEETLEKATVAEQLPREVRSLGLGILAALNGLGDMVSSLFVGYLLYIERPGTAFGAAAGCGALGVIWLLAMQRTKIASNGPRS